MKISFTNQLRLIANRYPKADIHTILDAIGSDSRIGKKYLRAPVPVGGPCFPRDNRLLAYAARQKGLEAPLAEATDRVNLRPDRSTVEQSHSHWSARDDVVAVLGMAWRPDTFITEEAAGLFLAPATLLKRHGYRVVVHPISSAKPANAPALHEFEHIPDPAELAKRHDVKLAVICCPWPQYRNLKVGSKTKIITALAVHSARSRRRKLLSARNYKYQPIRRARNFSNPNGIAREYFSAENGRRPF